MPKVPRGKVGLYVYIDRSTYSQLWKHINREYPESKHGALSREINNAIKQYLARKNAQKLGGSGGDPRVAARNKVVAAFNDVVEFLKEEYGIVPLEASYNNIIKAIEATRGPDNRTIKRWLDLFIRHGLIEPVTPAIFKIRYEKVTPHV